MQLCLNRLALWRFRHHLLACSLNIAPLLHTCMLQANSNGLDLLRQRAWRILRGQIAIGHDMFHAWRRLHCEDWDRHR